MRTIILGGGTFEPVRNHFSLAAPAFGTTARKLNQMILGSELYLTKMADPNSKLISNDDVSNFIDTLLDDDSVGTIILNVAFCDFKSRPIDGVENGFHAERLLTAEGDFNLTLTPTEKVIKKIRLKRPDIFLVGFKTTTNKSPEDQFLTGLKMMKSTKCNLVLCNDTVTRNNLIITPEESIYGQTTDRDKSLQELVDIINMRSNLTYNRSRFTGSPSYDINHYTPDNFQKVIQFLIDNGGFLENNGNGFTPGHFCYRLDENAFYSSQRKANHNLVFDEGMSLVIVKDDTITVFGRRKASVGAMSQHLMLKNYPDYDCIIHTHNPLKEGSLIPIAEQKPFQCGSLECGMNTVSNLEDFDGIKAVYLNKHGANILFKSSEKPEKIINFIKENLELGIKVK
jgi:hypothetical protein